MDPWNRKVLLPYWISMSGRCCLCCRTSERIARRRKSLSFIIWLDFISSYLVSNKSSFGQLSKRETRANSKAENECLKVRNLQNAFPDIENRCRDLNFLTETISKTFNSNSLDITHGFMSSKTAKAVYSTLRSGLRFILEYFDYSELPDLKSKIIDDTLLDRQVG